MQSSHSKTIRVERTGPETALLRIELPKIEENQFSLESGAEIEKYCFFLSVDELYALTSAALKAASVKIKLNPERP